MEELVRIYVGFGEACCYIRIPNKLLLLIFIALGPVGKWASCGEFANGCLHSTT